MERTWLTVKFTILTFLVCFYLFLEGAVVVVVVVVREMKVGGCEAGWVVGG